MSVREVSRPEGSASVERTVHARSGWPMLLLTAVATAVPVTAIVAGAMMMPPDEMPVTTAAQTLGVVLLVVGIVGVCVVPLLLLMGFFTIQPNQARVLILFGDYKGTVLSLIHISVPHEYPWRLLSCALHTKRPPGPKASGVV